MKKIYNKFLIISSLAIFLGGSYIYFMKDLTREGIVPTAYGSSLTSSNGTETPLLTSTNDKINSDTAFLSTLVSLKAIKIDTTIFESDSFKKLQNNSVKIEPVLPGRINPFAPIETIQAQTVAIIPKVVTNQPSQIMAQTVSFNGTINTVAGVTDTYFEYGPTLALGITTTSVKQSLVGTFIKNIIGLNSKTNYFYKACAKINGQALCGEVISFTTN